LSLQLGAAFGVQQFFEESGTPKGCVPCLYPQGFQEIWTHTTSFASTNRQLIYSLLEQAAHASQQLKFQYFSRLAAPPTLLGAIGCAVS
jgi:hypothetical protein